MLLPNAKNSQELFSENLPLSIEIGPLSFECKGNLRDLLNTNANAHPSDLKVRESGFPAQIALRLLQGQDQIFQV